MKEEIISRTEDRPPAGDMLTVLNDAIEGGRVDLYLQPIVTLPERKLRYYEGLTRLRTATDEIVMPRDYLPVAERERLMPIVDNVLLVKSVQLLRRLRSEFTRQGCVLQHRDPVPARPATSSPSSSSSWRRTAGYRRASSSR